LLSQAEHRPPRPEVDEEQEGGSRRRPHAGALLTVLPVEGDSASDALFAAGRLCHRMSSPGMLLVVRGQA
jgi:hypothetical protein